MADAYQMRLLFTGEDRLSNVVGRMKHNLKDFGSAAMSAFGRAGRIMKTAAQEIGPLGTAVTALSSGLVLKKLFSLSEFATAEEALIRMQSDMELNRETLKIFQSDLAGFAGKAGESFEQVYRSAQKLSVPFKDPKAVMQILEASAFAADAIGTDLATANDAVLQLMQIYGQGADKAKQIAEALAASRLDVEKTQLAMQRAAGSAALGRNYKDVLAFFGGLQKAGLTSTRVVMKYDEAMNSLYEKAEILKLSGIDVFKIDPNTKERVAKDAVEILEEIQARLQKYGKGKTKWEISKEFDKAFGPGTGEGILYLIGHLKELKAAREDQGNAAAIAAKRAADAEKSWEEQLRKVKGHLQAIKMDLAWIYDIGKVPVEWFAKHPTATKAAGYAAAGASLTALGGMLYYKGKKIIGSGGGLAAGVATGKILEKTMGITPVFVTNWPAGGMGGGGKEETAVGAAAKYGKWGALGAFGGPTAAVVGTGLASFFHAGFINKKMGETWKLAGFDVPKEGGFAGWVGQKISEILELGQNQQFTYKGKNEVNISISIDEKGRVVAQTADKDTDLAIKSMRRGYFGEGGVM